MKDDLKGTKDQGKEKGVVDFVVEINDSLVRKSPSVELSGGNSMHEDEGVNLNPRKLEPLKVNPLSKDFSYLNDDNTSMFKLLDMAHLGAIGTFKLAKWTLQEFNKVNIKIKGLKENMQNMSKGTFSDILIERLVDLECYFIDSKSMCE